MNTRIHLTNAFTVITLLSLNTHNAFAGGTEKSRYSSNTPASHNHDAHDHSSHHSGAHSSAHTSAHTSAHSGADAPIGVMGDHMHGAGEWMFSLRQIKMEMSGNKIGSNNASDTEILSIANTNAMMPPNLRVVPQHMEMDMTMLGVMYAPNADLTFMAMTGYVQKTMRLTTYNMMGMRIGNFETESEGFGDTTISALFRGQMTATSQIHYALGLSLPTGDIEEQDTVLTPMNTRIAARLPYAMQTGSGSYDLKPAITFNKHFENYSFGGQISAVVRLNDNDSDYRLGDIFTVQSWISKGISPTVSASLRLKGTSEEKIDGRDTLIDKPIQSADPNFYGGERLNLGIGLNLAPKSGPLAQKRVDFELVGPIYEKLNGPQMSQDWSLIIGFKTGF
ncbi:MAG: transporter [Alphaproteobacteria bacterium]|nr:transporter [Alphaproteobacteria bacterium]